MNNGARQASVVSGSQVMAAGFASAAAAFVTSRFGVAGTLLGAALTAMIITGGSAIFRAYLESVTGNVRKVPRKLRERRNRWKAGRTAEASETAPGRPDLRDNFAGRMRAALDWFSRLPALTRRSILIKGLIAAAVAFVVGMAAVYGVERVIGNSLSCGIWAKCPEGATPGIKLGGGDATGANSSLSLGRARANPAAPGSEARDPFQQNPLQQNPSQQNPSQQNPSQRDPSFQRVEPGRQQPAPSNNDEPGRGIFGPDTPVEQEPPAQPKPPSSPSPTPEESPPPGGGGPPADGSASPAPPE